jgi:hypothetical protein
MVQTLSIRTKLIMAMLALVASVALMGVAADDANADGVTEIRDVQNFTPYFVYAWNHENGTYRLIFPNSAYQYNQWVPWATNANEFNGGKYIELGFVRSRFGATPDPCFISFAACPQYAIWQESTNRQPNPGDFIRYTRSLQYTPSAPPMVGDSKAGLRRNLIISYSLDPNGVAVMHASLEKTK